MVTLIDKSQGTFPSSFPAPKTSFQQSVVPIQDIQAICSCRTAAIRDGGSFEHDQQPPGVLSWCLSSWESDTKD